MTSVLFKLKMFWQGIRTTPLIDWLCLAGIAGCVLFAVAWYGTIMYVLLRVASYIGSLY